VRYGCSRRWRLNLSEAQMDILSPRRGTADACEVVGEVHMLNPASFGEGAPVAQAVPAVDLDIRVLGIEFVDGQQFAGEAMACGEANVVEVHWDATQAAAGAQV